MWSCIGFPRLAGHVCMKTAQQRSSSVGLGKRNTAHVVNSTRNSDNFPFNSDTAVASTGMSSSKSKSQQEGNGADTNSQSASESGWSELAVAQLQEKIRNSASTKFTTIRRLVTNRLSPNNQVVSVARPCTIPGRRLLLSSSLHQTTMFKRTNCLAFLVDS